MGAMFSFIFTALPIIHVAATTNATVHLGYASYKGSVDPSSGVTSWKGLAYAQPPIGERRFSAPQPPLHVEGLQYADKVKAACLGVGDTPGDDYNEDCLYLDVYAPTNATADSNLPVLFYIPGGGFVHNDPRHADATPLVIASGHSMIVVFIHWRVSVYGFLAGTEVVRAADAVLNNGLRDQVQALDWVRSHIDAFGGDPRSVTLGGVSAGAGSIAVLLTAYEGANETLNSLYHAAALEEPWLPALFTPRQMDHVYQNVIRSVGCDGVGSIECLRNVSVHELQNATSLDAGLTLPGGVAAPLYVWGPTIDGGLVPDVTYALLQAGKLHRVPSITGDDQNGGGYSFFQPSTINLTSQQDVNQALVDQWPTLTARQLAQFQELYTTANVPSIPFEEVGGPYYDLLAKEFDDIMVQCPATFLNEVLNRNDSPSWSYIYNVSSPHDPAHGAVHGEEVSTLFTLPLGENDNFTKPDIAQMQAYWTSFVRFQDPNMGYGAAVPYWQSWNSSTRPQLWFEAATPKTAIYSQSVLQRQRCALLNSLGAQMRQ